MAGEDVSAAAGVAVVRVWERKPDLRPRMDQDKPIKSCPKLLRKAQQCKGSQP